MYGGRWEEQELGDPEVRKEYYSEVKGIAEGGQEERVREEDVGEEAGIKEVGGDRKKKWKMVAETMIETAEMCGRLRREISIP